MTAGHFLLTRHLSVNAYVSRYHKAGSVTNDFSTSPDFTRGCFGACKHQAQLQQSNNNICSATAEQHKRMHQLEVGVTHLNAVLNPLTHVVVFHAACLITTQKVAASSACKTEQHSDSKMTATGQSPVSLDAPQTAWLLQSVWVPRSSNDRCQCMTYEKNSRRFAFKGQGGWPHSQEAIAISVNHISQVSVAYHDQFFSLAAA